MTVLPPDENALFALLDYYVAAGVTAVLSDTAVDRFVESAEARARVQPRAPSKSSGGLQQARPSEAGSARTRASAPAPSFDTGNAPGRPPMAGAFGSAGGQAVMPGEEAILSARQAASAAQTLEDLEKILRDFNGCNLKLTARNTVFSDGNPKARVMFVGEAPGADEDRIGKPFVGKSGQLLDRIMAAVGLDRTSVYIANVIFWRPPGNRTPSDAEVAICRPFIRRQIELANPDILVFLGSQSTKALLPKEGQQGIMKLRGHWLDYDTGSRIIRLMPTLHPAGLLRQPLNKRLIWRDMLEIRSALEKA